MPTNSTTALGVVTQMVWQLGIDAQLKVEGAQTVPQLARARPVSR
ncbi:MAG: hypothetical protein AB4038_18195 [Prochloraceae cyanobacterium]